MGYSLTILNAIRNQASAEYQARIPQATQDNYTTIGQAILNYTPFLTEFTGLLGKIALTVFGEKIAHNKLAPFKKGLLPNGMDIEEIFVEMAKGVAYDPEGKNPLGRRKPENVHVMYHRQNWQQSYEVSVSDQQVKNAFLSENGIQSLTNSLVNSMYSGANWDEYLQMKNLLATYNGFFDYQVAPITDQASATAFVKTCRKAINDLSYMNTEYNAAGVKTYSDPSELVLLVNKDVISDVDVDVLARAFNMGKTDFIGEVIAVDDFGSLTDTYGILLDKSSFMVYDTLRNIESIRNPQGMFTNYFLNIWQIQSMSKFKNAIRLTTATVS